MCYAKKKKKSWKTSTRGLSVTTSQKTLCLPASKSWRLHEDLQTLNIIIRLVELVEWQLWIKRCLRDWIQGKKYQRLRDFVTVKWPSLLCDPLWAYLNHNTLLCLCSCWWSTPEFLCPKCKLKYTTWIVYYGPLAQFMYISLLFTLKCIIKPDHSVLQGEAAVGGNGYIDREPRLFLRFNLALLLRQHT